MLTIFSPSFLICLAIIFILVGGVFMYFNQKISQQNDKINGMFDLVNTMAEEINYIRSSSINTIQPFTRQTQQVMTNVNGGFRQREDELIQVSDDDEDDDEDEDEDEDDDEDEDEDEDEDDDEDDDEEEDEHDDNKEKNIKIINILSDTIYGVEHNDVEIIEDDNNNESDDDDEDDDEDNDEDNDLSNEDDEPVELIDLINHNALEHETNYNTFLKEDPISISSNGENYSIDLNLLKTINISNSSSNENIDYKKMSLTKLREIVVERNLATDSSKMKKNELLKLLE